MKKTLLFTTIFLLLHTILVGQGLTCGTATNICSAATSYRAVTGSPDPGGSLPGGSGCYADTPNESWFYLKANAAGTIAGSVTFSPWVAAVDEDISVYGTAGYNTVAAACTDITDGSVPTPIFCQNAGNTPSTGMTFSFTAVANKVYLILMTNYSGTTGLTGTVNITTGLSLITPTITTQPPTMPICVGSTFALAPSTDGTWISNNTAVATVTAAGVATAVGSGTTTFKYTPTGSACSVTSNSVTVNGLTGGTITANSTGTQSPACGGPINPNTTLNTTSATGLGTITYQWQSSTDNITFSTISGATNNTYAFTGGFAVTSYFRRVATSTLNGVACTANSNTLTYVINALPTVASITPGGTTNVCSGNTLQLSDATSLVTNLWSSSNNLYATVDATGLVTGLAAGAGNSVTIYYKVTDNNGCSNTATKTVGIISIVAPVVTVVNNCGMGTTTLSTTALGSLLWSTGATTSSITVSKAGSYTVKSTLNGCVSALGTGVANPITAPLIP